MGTEPGPQEYLQKIFALVPEETAEIGGAQKAIGPGKAGPGRSFRKSVHDQFNSMLTWVAPSVRPITAASQVYDQMLLYESQTLTPGQAKAQKNKELVQVRCILDKIAEWEPTRADTAEKNQRAVDFLKGKMQEDVNLIQEEIADIDAAISAK